MKGPELLSLLLFLFLFTHPWTANADCGDNVCDCAINLGPLGNFKLCEKFPVFSSLNNAMNSMKEQIASTNQRISDLGQQIAQKKDALTKIFQSGGDLVTENSPRSFVASVQKASVTINKIGQRAPSIVSSLVRTSSQLPQLLSPQVVQKFQPASRLVADYFSTWFVKQLTNFKDSNCLTQALRNGTMYFGVSSQLLMPEISFSVNFAGIEPLVCLVQSEKQLLSALKNSFDNTQPFVVAQTVLIKASKAFVTAVTAVANLAEISSSSFCQESNITSIELPPTPDASAPEWMKSLHAALSRVATILGPSGYLGSFYSTVRQGICSAKSPEAMVNFAKKLDDSINKVNFGDVASALVDGFFNAALRTANGFQNYLTNPNAGLPIGGTAACLIQHLRSTALWINLKLSISAQLLPPFAGVQHTFGVSCHRDTIQCLSCVFKSADDALDFILNKVNQFNTTNIFTSSK